MPDLSSYIDFSVRFDLTTGTPKMILEDTSSYPSGVNEDITGYFSITSPDGGTDSGSWSSPDVTWDGSSLTTKELVLRLNSQGNIQAGNYTVVYNINHPSYTPTVLSRTFNTSYIAPTLNLVEAFDVFTPELKYYDQTSYGIPGYAYTILDQIWEYSSAVGGDEVSGDELDLVISSEYYDAEYLINFYVDVLYESDTYAYLTIRDVLTKSITTSADTPPSIGNLVEYLNDLKAELDANSNNCTLNKEYKARYEYAASLLFNIKESCRAGLLEPLNRYVEEFLSITNNFVIPPYTNTNEPILAYDCSCDVDGNGGVNIYNSDGTLTGDRTLSGGANDLLFNGLNLFEVQNTNQIWLTTFGSSVRYRLENNIANGINLSGFNLSNSNLTIFKLSDSLINTRYNNNEIGLYLDFAGGGYAVGDVNDINGDGYLYVSSKESGIISGKNNLNATCGIFADGGNTRVGAYLNSTLSGLSLDFSNNTYQFGDFSRINLFINSNLKLLYTADALVLNGLYCDVGAHAYKLGRFNGGNGTHLLISDGQTYPLRLSGSTLLSATSGSTSGLYLKININGTDYKIELKNP